MNDEQAAKIIAELGNETRLAIFRHLVKAGPTGLPVGKIQDFLGIPGSTLSHHISRLVNVELIRQERESRTLYCIPQHEKLREVTEYLMAECCTGFSETDEDW